MTECIHETENGIYLNVHVQPGASKEGVCGLHGDAIKLKVRAQAREGEANNACIKMLSDMLKVPRSSMEITMGYQSRSKRIFIKGVAMQHVKESLNI